MMSDPQHHHQSCSQALQISEMIQSRDTTLRDCSISQFFLPLGETKSGGKAQLKLGDHLSFTSIIPRYHLVKLLERFGKVKLFDFLFHKSGPMEGQPRGYCFVNFHTKEEAGRVIHCLNGKLALSKKLVVHWAHAQVHIASLTWRWF
ncbi:probable RNA-binding protein 18 isoform X2 [Coregonus clupeaformis]|uniref:probable RNA-binding protein 18 isoform X2 n=1 Tax=Coregonus clupeaformis TaxID=59861 RepID=UPI001BE0797A|nr:probable RNA-binding protein 18 isoform X2 [Coregonus clupeaformis]